MTITKCLASGCDRHVTAGMVMCFSHWRGVPLRLKQNAWNAYRIGLEMGSGEASPAYQQALGKVKDYVSEKERSE